MSAPAVQRRVTPIIASGPGPGDLDLYLDKCLYQAEFASDRQRFMAERAGARTVEIRASHVSLISRPDAVTGLIIAAARTVG